MKDTDKVVRKSKLVTKTELDTEIELERELEMLDGAIDTKTEYTDKPATVVDLNEAMLKSEQAMESIKKGSRLEKFLDGILMGLPVKVAYAKAGYAMSSLQHAYKILQKTKIKNILNARFQERQVLIRFVTREYVASIIHEIVLKPNQNDGMKIKAIGLLAKIMGYDNSDNIKIAFQQKQEPLFIVNSNYDGDKEIAFKNRIKELESKLLKYEPLEATVEPASDVEPLGEAIAQPGDTVTQHSSDSSSSSDGSDGMTSSNYVYIF